MKKQFLRLHNSITSTIYEGTVKLGYDKGSSMNIYYDLDLLNYLLDKQFADQEECLLYLNVYQNEVNTDETLLVIQLVKHRFQFAVTDKGIQKILSEYDNKPFLRDLVDLARTHDFSLEEIQDLFQKYSSCSSYHFEETNNEEFQYVFSFDDPAFDEYVYCFNLADCYYHRLLPYDYERL